MEAELRAQQATRPRFMSLISRKRREEYQSSLAKTEKTVEQLRHRMQMLDLCEPHIAKMIEEEIEKTLRGDCPEYIQALAAWEQFRAEVAPEIFPGDTERSVASTEEVLTAAARTSVVGRL
jgi:hypothetical protein